MADYRKLGVWQRSHRLVKHVYKLSRRVRREGHAELASQMKRAAGSVPANIVEGSEFKSRKEFARFLRYAAASAAELEEHVTLTKDVEALFDWHAGPALKHNAETRKMLRGLIKKVDPDSDDSGSGSPS